MNKNDISAFAIPIRYGMLNVNDLNKKLIEDIFLELNNNGNEKRSGVGVYQTKFRGKIKVPLDLQFR